jgi:hypothetical protein
VPSEPPLFAGWTLFCIFQVELRRWLSSDVTNLRTGLDQLERAFRMMMVGLGLAPEKRREGLATKRKRRVKP